MYKAEQFHTIFIFQKESVVKEAMRKLADLKRIAPQKFGFGWHLASGSMYHLYITVDSNATEVFTNNIITIATRAVSGMYE